MTVEAYKAFIIAFAVAIALFPSVIGMLRRLKAGQVISTDGPQAHMAKAGTPTMGGFLIVLVASLVALLVALLSRNNGIAGIGVFAGMLEDIQRLLLPLLVMFLAYGALGFLDDYLIVRKGKALGLRAREKLLGQFIIAISFVAWIAYSKPLGPAEPGLFVGGRVIMLGWLYYVLAVFYIVGWSNAVNIADGLDGLVGGLSGITAVAIAAGTISSALPVVSPLFPVLCFAIAGSCAAFLWYNANPAKVFMGDTGSLALGGVFAGLAIMTRQEIALLIYGLVFIVEIGSVVIQSGYFKYSRRRYGQGRRIFKMSPLHHHFELAGWPEQLVVFRFWIVGAVCAAAGLIGRAWGLW